MLQKLQDGPGVGEVGCIGEEKDFTCFGKITGSCGETMEIYLRIEGEIIEDARFASNGCSFSKRCASAVVRLAAGRTVDEAALIAADSILDVVGDLPEAEAHCAALAAETLHAAIHSWMIS